MYRPVRTALLGFALVWAVSDHVTAQATFGTITGRVTDASGAVLPGTNVLVVNEATNVERTVVADSSGNYEVTHLIPGVYTVSVEFPGFHRFVHRDVLLEALRTVRIDVRLEVGTLEDEVTVRGTPVVESEAPTISQVRTHRQILDLPLNLRGTGQLNELARTVPTHTQGGGSLRSFGGSRGTQTYFNVDGVSSNSIVFGNQDSTLQPPNDAIQEVRIEYVNNKAEFDSPGTLTAVTRSGSNEFRGSGFWNNFHSALAARDFFATTRGHVDPVTGEEFHTQDHIAGGSVGGPIARNRAFFFFAYERDFDRRPDVVTATVPTARMRQGDFSDLTRPIRNPFTGENLPGNIVPGELHNAASLKVQERFYPLPNYGDPNLQVGNFRGTFPRSRDINRINARVDYRHSATHALYVRVGFLLSDHNSLPAGFLPADFVGGHFNSLNRAPQGNLSHTWTIASNLLNEFKAGFARGWVSTGGPLPGQEIIDFLGIEGLLARQPPDERAAPDIRLTGFNNISWGGDNRRVANTYQVSNQLTWLRNRHTMKMGAEFRPMQYYGPARPGFGRYDFTGRHTGHAYADFLLGLPESTLRSNERPPLYAQWWSFGGFFQDDFRISPRLTLHYGLRYDFNKPPVDKFDILSTFDPATGAVVLPSERAVAQVHPLFPAEVPLVTASDVGLPRSLRNSDTNNFNPRVGFAFRPWADTQTVVRGGFGTFSQELTADILCAFLCRHGPFNLNEGFTNAIIDGQPLLTFDRPFLDLGQRQGALDVRGMDHNLRNPSAQQWNLTAERDVGFNTGLRVSYIGTRSTDITFRRNINQAQASTEPFSADRRPYPLYREILFAESRGREIYNALAVNVERRMERGLYLQLAWTWAKKLTDTEDASEGGPTLENAYDLRGWRGNSQFVPRHRLGGNLIWEVPVGSGRRYLDRSGLLDQILGGWQLSLSSLAQTGDFLNPTFSGADPSNTETFGGRPDRVCDGNLPRQERSIQNWFDTSCFARPPNGRFGDAGRGIIVGPGRWSVNTGLFKRFQLARGSTLRVHATATNVFNRVNFAAPNMNTSVAAGGTITSIQTRDFGGPREVMLGLRYAF
jgi:hypothetical protein